MKRVSLASFCGCVVFAACLLGAVASFAEERKEERKKVDVWVAGPAARVDAMDRALSEPLGRLAVDLRLAHQETVDPKTVIDGASSMGEAFVRVWIDLGASSRVTLYFVDAAWERILVRKISVEKDLDEVEREEIAQIVRSAVEALLGGAKLGITREEARAELLQEPAQPAPPSPPPPPPSTPRRTSRRVEAPARTTQVGVDAGVFYEGELYAGSLWQGPGLLAGAEARGPFAWGGRFTLQYRTPLEVEGDELGARLQALSLRALARTSWKSGTFGAGAAVGLGLDLTHVDPISVSNDAVADRSSWDVVPVARGLGEAGIALAGVWVLPVVGLDVDLTEVRHVGKRAGQKYTVFELSRARPFLGLELVIPTDGN